MDKQKLNEREGVFWEPESETGKIAENYLAALLKEDRHHACDTVLACVDRGISVQDIYLGVLQPVQLKIGWLWQTNKINVAQEHFCSATTQLVMSQLYRHIVTTEKTGMKMIAACVPGELHEIGIRMVADFFEMEGWDSLFLGASTPTNSIIDMITDKEVALVAISATITFNLPAAIELATSIKKSEVGEKTKVIIGGRLFNIDSDLWKNVSVDAYACNARDAVITAKSLFA